jgi:hypothetical protein
MENDAQARLNIHDEPTRNPIEDLSVATGVRLDVE